jgi:hypothetical protein
MNPIVKGFALTWFAELGYSVGNELHEPTLGLAKRR